MGKELVVDQYTVDNYKELIDEIDMLSIHLNGLVREKDLIIRKMGKGPSDINGLSYDGMPAGNAVRKDMIRYLENIKRLDEKIEMDTEYLEIKEDTLAELEKKIRSLQGVEYKVAFLAAKGKDLKEISQMLGYSYEHIRRVHSNIKRATIMLQTNRK